MNGLSLGDFQRQVSELLLRHRSLLDVLSKLQQSNSSVNRSVIKGITECGCIEIHATKQPYTENISLEEAHTRLETHVEGQLCENCKEIIIDQLGKNMFYMSALCNLLDIRLEDVVERESKKCSTLGFFNMS